MKTLYVEKSMYGVFICRKILKKFCPNMENIDTTLLFINCTEKILFEKEKRVISNKIFLTSNDERKGEMNIKGGVLIDGV